MMKTTGYAIFIVFSFVVGNVAAVPRYGALTQQICDSGVRPIEPSCSSLGQCQDMSLPGRPTAEKEAISNKAWSGTRKDLDAIVAKAEEKEMYGFENNKHLGRNATMLIPASYDEMLRELKHGNSSKWKVEPNDGYHAPDAKRGDNLWTAKQKSGKGEIVKYTNKDGGEVVYNLKTGQIVMDGKMGTKNFEAEYKDGLLKMLRHKKLDVDPHNKDKNEYDRFSKDGDQYKYVGILYARDPDDPDRYYIIDGQTGMPMDAKQVAEFPTTLSDMWKDMGLACVRNDAEYG